MNKLPVCVNMLVRDGDDVIAHSLGSVLPYVEQAIVTIDNRSADKTREIARELIKYYPYLTVYDFAVRNPKIDLVDARNQQIVLSKTDWIFVVDSDEIWPKSELEKIVLGDNDAYGFCNAAVADGEREVYAMSRRPTMRIFRRKPYIAWQGEWGNEKLVYDGKDLCFHFKVLEPRYIHFTLQKKDKWRKEMGMGRKRKVPITDDSLRKMPEHFIKIIKQINA